MRTVKTEVIGEGVFTTDVHEKPWNWESSGQYIENSYRIGSHEWRPINHVTPNPARTRLVIALGRSTPEKELIVDSSSGKIVFEVPEGTDDDKWCSDDELLAVRTEGERRLSVSIRIGRTADVRVMDNTPSRNLQSSECGTMGDAAIIEDHPLQLLRWSPKGSLTIVDTWTDMDWHGGDAEDLRIVWLPGGQLTWCRLERPYVLPEGDWSLPQQWLWAFQNGHCLPQHSMKP